MSFGQGAAIFGCSGPVLTRDEAAFFREADPFGFILFARNVETPDQVRRLTDDLRAATGHDAPILVDQEGGRVQRLRAPHWREWLPPLDQVAQSAAQAARGMAIRSRIIAHELRAVGIDANCAPCCDLASENTHPFLRNRCYGSDPVEVGGIARAVAEAHLAAACDPDRPATHSSAMIDVIRNRIGFAGLLMTDDLNMQALSGTLASRAAAARAAGCDIALHCKGDLAEMEAVAAVAGTLDTASRGRAAAALALRRSPDPVDIAALEDDLAAILRGSTHV